MKVMGRVFNIVTLVLMLTGCAMCHYQKRVLGWPCPQDQGRHHVVLTTPGDKKGLGHCGGSLLNSEWIITAAHCEKQFFADGTIKIIKDLQVLIGKHPDERKAIREYVKERHKFKDTVEHDIMLLKIDKSNTGEAVFVDLPDTTCSAPIKDERVDIFGWKTADVDPTTKEKINFRHAAQLQCGQLDVKPCATTACKDASDYSKYHLLCGVDSKNNACDSCDGDSGSGLTYKGKLHGVLIAAPFFLCSDTVDFMDICHPEYRAWISKTIRPVATG